MSLLTLATNCVLGIAWRQGHLMLLSTDIMVQTFPCFLVERSWGTDSDESCLCWVVELTVVLLCPCFSSSAFSSLFLNIVSCV